MKLNEIFDIERKSVNAGRGFKQNFVHPKTDDEAKKMKAGFYSHVVDDSDPHMVNKISHEQDDAYNFYVNYLATSKIYQENPHFPRIYNSNVYKAQSGEKKMHWKMEKLLATLSQYISGNDVSFEDRVERIRILSNLYLDDSVQRMVEDKLKMNLALKAKGHLLQALTTGEGVKDGPYKEALQIIDKLSNDSGFRVDHNTDNIMLRFGPHQPQLVLIDPLAD